MSLRDGHHPVPSGKVANVTTHLEMTSPAPLRGAPCPAGYDFVPGPRDVAGYRDLIGRVGHDWLWFSRLSLERDVLAGILNDPSVDLHTLQYNKTAEAILELDFREPGACELAFFGVTPALIGTGAGAFLMDRAIELAWSHSINRFHLHTCTMDSPQALPFYIRSGFTPVKRTVEIIDDPRATGVLAADAAPHIPRL